MEAGVTRLAVLGTMIEHLAVLGIRAFCEVVGQVKALTTQKALASFLIFTVHNLMYAA